MARFIDELKSVTQKSKEKKDDFSLTNLKLKEHIQYYVLNFIYNNEASNKLNFYGGTCARICYGLNRLSEDLDFETAENIDLNELGQTLETLFKEQVQYKDVYTKIQSGKLINRITLSFPIYFSLGLSPLRNSVLKVKVEIKKQHKIPYKATKTTISKHGFTFILRHYDLPTLMAGKIIACLHRSFRVGKTGITIKGRDYYDLIWYMSQKIIPNEKRLKSTKEKSTIKKAFTELTKRVERIKKRDLKVDLIPLFEDSKFISNWIDNFHEMYESLVKEYQ